MKHIHILYKQNVSEIMLVMLSKLLVCPIPVDN